MSEFATEHQDDPVCPHCGHIQRDAWEWDFHGDETLEHECGKCCTVFTVRRHVSISYSSFPKDKESKP